MTYICDPNTCLHDGRGHAGTPGSDVCWHEATIDRLLWLYGPDGCAARDAAADHDLNLWRSLGRAKEAA